MSRVDLMLAVFMAGTAVFAVVAAGVIVVTVLQMVRDIRRHYGL